VVQINSTVALALFGGSSSSSSTTSGYGVGADLLTAWAKARAGVGVDLSTLGQDPNKPLADVWQPGITPSDDALVSQALAGKAFYDTNAKLFSDLGATGDYRRLFALHTGLSTLNALATKLGDTTLNSFDKARIQDQFNRGLSELQQFFTKQEFDKLRLAEGDRVDTAQTTLAIPASSEDYTTAIIQRGSLAGPLAGLDKNAKFDIVVKTLAGTTKTANIDLSQMGSIPRSLGNVISFINNKLVLAGVATRLAASDQTPKTQVAVVGGKVVEQPYTGLRQYALKVDVSGGETVSFAPVAATPAFYLAGQVGAAGARLVKLSDVGGQGGQPIWLDRPDATADPIGAYVATGFLGPGDPYSAAPADAHEVRTNTFESVGPNTFDTLLRANGEAVLKLTTDDGRAISVTTGWRAEDVEAWRTQSGETDGQGMLNDLAERLTQLLHEQGVAAGVDVWQNGTDSGLSVFAGDHVTVASLTISGKAATLTAGADPSGGYVGGLRAGVFARRFETGDVIAAGAQFIGDQIFTVTTSTGVQSFTISGGATGIDAATLEDSLNNQLRTRGVKASASLVDTGGGQLALRFETLHDTTAISASINGVDQTANLQDAGAFVQGGLPIASAGEPYGDGVRTYAAQGGSPLLTNTGALDISIVVATATGDKTVNVSVSAQERLDNPDVAPGQWDQTFQDRLQTALNAAGVYVGALSSDLTQWGASEDAGQRIASISVNGAALDLASDAPALGLGGAFSVERSFTSAQASTGTSDDVAALIADPNVSITFGTIWGDRTVSATLDPGDPATLDSAALRLNEALAAQGYDLGVAAVDLSGGGAGLRVVSGDSHTIRNVGNIALGATSVSASLDPIDSASHADDPVGAASVAERANRDVSVTESIPSASTFSAPSVGSTGWFAGRAFDVKVGGDAKVATARGVATGADGSVYVLADLSGDSSQLDIKGARDVALFKYDSAGNLSYSRVLGAADQANGFALAVSSDGKVAVAGSIQGGLSNTGAPIGGADSFVSLFDATGSEVWTVRRGAKADDQVNAIAFAPDGSIIVAGKTDSALGPAIALGGTDGYVRGFSASGLEQFTRQFGSAQNDSASALLVRSDGAGGVQIFTGGVENSRGVIRSFTYSAAAGFAAGATRDIGNLYGGAINALAADGSSLYVGGAAVADHVNAGPVAREAAAGQDGFVARLDVDLASTALDRTTYLGSAQDDSVTGLTVVNGVVYAAGAAGGVIGGQGAASTKAGFLARLDDAGEIGWLRSFTTANGALTPAGLAVDTGGASALDALGLPRGVVGATDSTALVNRSSLRVGDQFNIGVDGRLLTTIKIGATDTMSSLLAQINRAIGSAGHAQIISDNGADRIKITPTDGKAVRIESGPAGRNALSSLGLVDGIVSKSNAGHGTLRSFGLGLITADLTVDTPAAIAQTKAELSAAMSIVRGAYDSIVSPNAKPQTDAEKALEARRTASSSSTAYYTAQLANYQAALTRLGG
jgi:WD40 repeat protein